jgi:hypothetical protein
MQDIARDSCCMEDFYRPVGNLLSLFGWLGNHAIAGYKRSRYLTDKYRQWKIPG